MKKIIFVLSVIYCVQHGYGQNNPGISIIPQPVSMKQNAGSFAMPSTLPVVFEKNNDLQKIVASLSTRIKTELRPNGTVTKNALVIEVKPNSVPVKEGYKLTVTSNGITLLANEASGIFYGMQTLLQLMPADVEVNRKVFNNKSWKIPAVTIEDHPRFGWRGLMLDVSRHFFTVQEVKDFISQMAKYKFNMLHLHLTDDQGWRIEIKSLPKLTEVGAWRVEKTGTFGRFSKPLPGEPRSYGGFYTHEDIKELVRFAGEHYINILPEIDMPGHSLAALASYPELSCTPGEYAVNSGEQFMIWPGGGQHFYGTIDNTICPANEKAYEFIDKVFTEVAQLFPFGYIHMGGDETARNFWEKTDAIKALMEKEKLKDLDAVQSYFVRRVEKIINSKGKKMIGWDEILQGGLAPNAAVMSWRGMKGGIEAVKLGHEVVMSPSDFAYLDYMQSDATMEPPVYASLRLKKAYSFDPAPEGLDKKLVKGGQANLWTEQIYNMRHAQYMLWPRAFAIAESVWSPLEVKNWNYFVSRTEQHFPRLDSARIKYSPAMYDPIIAVSKKDTATIIVNLSTEVEGLTIHYSFDNSFPDNYYPAYSAPLTVPKDASFMKMVSYRDGRPIGRMMTIPITELRKRAGIK